MVREGDDARSWTEIREDFPVLKQRVHDKPLVYLDSAASSQMPQQVLDALIDYHSNYHSNVHRGVHTLSQRATNASERARMQAARYINGDVTAREAAIWEMSHEWGKAGQREVARLAALPEAEHAELHRALAIAAATDSSYTFEERLGDPEWENLPERLIAAVQMVPAGAKLDPEVVMTLADYRLKDWVESCEQDAVPGCVLLQGDFNTRTEALEGVMFLPTIGGEYEVVSVWIDDDGDLVVGGYLRDPAYSGSVRLQAEDVQRVLDGDYRIGPSSNNALWLGERELNPEN